MAFGQGLDVTVVQVASAFCSLVNGGTYYRPSIIQGVLGANNTLIEQKPEALNSSISASTANQVREMVRIGRYTSFPTIDKAGYYVGGKSGTSQVIKDGQYADDETIATYLGYGGSENMSNYVIMVEVSGEHKVFKGSYHAMPIFTDISNWMLDYLKIQPKG